LWYLGLDSELVFVGDAGTTDAGRPSRRYGIEWSVYSRIARGLTLDADVSLSRARFADADPAGRAVPGALDRVISSGLTIDRGGSIVGSVRLRHFGPRPLVEDATISSESSTFVNGEISYRLSNGVQFSVEAFNLLGVNAADIDYYYRSRLPGEPSEGLDDVHTHPALPRTIRFGARLAF
jgi:hypothetical protein